jgi:hypothetical protein
VILYLLSVAVVIFGVDITEKIAAAQAAAEGATSVLLPPTMPALPEEQAWQMIAAEGGGTAVLLAIAVTVIWKKFSANQARQDLLADQRIEEARQQNKALVETQAQAITKLSEAMIRVEGAVKMSDANNTNAISRLSDTVQSALVRIDRHEAKIDAHHDSLMHHSSRLSVLESRRTPASTPAIKGS